MALKRQIVSIKIQKKAAGIGYRAPPQSGGGKVPPPSFGCALVLLQDSKFFSNLISDLLVFGCKVFRGAVEACTGTVIVGRIESDCEIPGAGPGAFIFAGDRIQTIDREADAGTVVVLEIRY